MQYVQIGKTDLSVSRICFGCWQLSPRFWGPVELGPWRQAVCRALELGVNFIDTADAYGDGYAEESLGAFLHQAGLRDRFVIATKFFWDFSQEKRHPDTSHDYILRACEASLRRLQTDRIDLYQIHAWDPLTHPEQVAAAFARLRQEGKVRWFGVSNLNADQIRMYLAHTEIECLQPAYSLLARDGEAHELPLCLEKRLGVIAYSPLYRGLLSGKYARDHVFQDTRAGNPLFRGKAFRHLLDTLDSLKPKAEAYGLTVPQLAISWVLTHPALSAAIVGIKEPAHIETIVPAATVRLSIPDWHEIAAVVDSARREALQMQD
jgi:aryl-alcohol dehydrogenase-like predicted oxidoreductase